MKTSYICTLFSLMTLTASAQSDTCNTCGECWAVGDTECCIKKTRTCPSSQCMTISEYCNLDNTIYQTVRKTCGDTAFCNRCIQVTTNSGAYIEASTQCCEGKECNADLEYKRICGGKPNGLFCPACYKNDTVNGCEPGDKLVACIGQQTECLVYQGVVQLSDGGVKMVSLQGCITEKSCTMGLAPLPGAKEISGVKMECKAALNE